MAVTQDSERVAHWQKVYETKAEDEVSWFQEWPEISLDMIAPPRFREEAAIIDIGGGESRLVDALLDSGHTDVTVLDLSAKALEVARGRLGARAGRRQLDRRRRHEMEPEATSYDIWHDRAAFHFLTEAADRLAYVERLRSALRPGGHVIIGTFAPDGPEKCSGLPVMRHDARSLATELGPDSCWRKPAARPRDARRRRPAFPVQPLSPGDPAAHLERVWNETATNR
jgi:SAM-dependent methyltransferase